MYVAFVLSRHRSTPSRVSSPSLSFQNFRHFSRWAALISFRLFLFYRLLICTLTVDRRCEDWIAVKVNKTTTMASMTSMSSISMSLKSISVRTIFRRPTQISPLRQYATIPPRPGASPKQPPTPSPPSSPSTSNSSSPPPYRRKPGWYLALASAQLVAGGILLFGCGYTVASTLNARDPVNIRDSTLLPSKLAIEHQEHHQPSYGSLAEYQSLIRDLQKLFKEKGKGDRVSTDKEDLETHGISDWSYHEEKRPTVVVWVESTEEAQEVVFLSRKYKVPITPFSGGTSLEGHFSSVSG